MPSAQTRAARSPRSGETAARMPHCIVGTPLAIRSVGIPFA
uniref:Uncharacterized protein n=1 Tax=Siphoviridae sp. ctE6L85 TaxID=2826202 RepID=A0A8S5QRF6_9CAUD|nr:MAG TPA: hypothetical protein [Siphoviridae sp. ctE6L85]